MVDVVRFRYNGFTRSYGSFTLCVLLAGKIAQVSRLYWYVF